MRGIKYPLMEETIENIKKNGTLLSRDGYKLTKMILEMTRKELIEEIIGTYGFLDLIELGFIEKNE
jgi:hypothetical protein|tara:strand:+ start:439 stop:636 length:198 start_codon:yes stop_codon:yes gene_type:complete